MHWFWLQPYHIWHLLIPYFKLKAIDDLAVNLRKTTEGGGGGYLLPMHQVSLLLTLCTSSRRAVLQLPTKYPKVRRHGVTYETIGDFRVRQMRRYPRVGTCT